MPILSPERAARLQRAWRAATRDEAAFVAAFHAHLFALDPSLRLLMAGEPLEARGQALVHGVTVAVRHADRFAPVGLRETWRAERGAVVLALVAALRERLPDAPPDEEDVAGWTALLAAVIAALRQRQSPAGEGRAAA